MQCTTSQHYQFRLTTSTPTCTCAVSTLSFIYRKLSFVLCVALIALQQCLCKLTIFVSSHSQSHKVIIIKTHFHIMKLLYLHCRQLSCHV